MILLPGGYSLCRMSSNESIPSWVFSSAFYTISKSADELSIIAESNLVPAEIKAESGWCILKIEQTLDLALTGITAKFSTALAAAGVNLCVIATYDTDYIMVKQEKLSVAIGALQQAGFIVNA
ncbi:MAG: ACT domain-containing protein [Sphingobacteriales bacterium]|nr:ACT domain-containing protein [Sphingobacteriales bacterium]MBI3719399.1 ACT domain-containing protein [Sphingobacteriales bacterium]